MLTTVIELVGLGLLALALALFVSEWSVPGGVAAAGAALICASLLITKLRGRG